MHRKALGSKKFQKDFQLFAFLAKKKVAKNQNVQSGRVVIVDVVEVDQLNCRWSTNIDSCAISFSLTSIPLLFLSELISPFSFMNPS